MKTFIIIIAIVAAFISGVGYGYEKGVVNNVVFDAPSRIYLLQAALKSDNPQDVIEDLISQQEFFMEDFMSRTNRLLLRLPVHQGAEGTYEEVLEKVRAYDKTLKPASPKPDATY